MKGREIECQVRNLVRRIRRALCPTCIHEVGCASPLLLGDPLWIVRRQRLSQGSRDQLALRIRRYRRAGYRVQVQSSSTDKESAPLWVERSLVKGRLVRRAEYYMQP